MKVLAIIPARGGSKGVPGKNIKLLGGRPLIAYTIESALSCPLITDLIVSTDSEETAKISMKYGAKVPFIRPSALATDQSSSIDVVRHALQFMEKEKYEYEIVCLLQPTSPFRPKNLINDCIKKLIERDLHTVLSVIKVPHAYNPHWVFESDTEGLLEISTGDREIIKRRQDLPDAFIRDGSIYLTRSDVVRNKASFYGSKIGYILNKSNIHINIDSLDDWQEAERLVACLKKSSGKK